MIVDHHLHLSLGYLPPLGEQDYAARMTSDLARLIQEGKRDELWKLQEPLACQIRKLLDTSVSESYPLRQAYQTQELTQPQSHMQTKLELNAATAAEQVEQSGDADSIVLHVQSVSFLDSWFNFSLLTHPVLSSSLNRSVFLYLGLHPWFISPHAQEALHEVELLINLIEQIQQEYPGCIHGLGEIGLDKGARAALPLQEQCLTRLLQANQSWQLPCSCHCVKAHNELLRLLKTFSGQGMIHGFNSSLEIAQSYQSLGFKLGLGLRWLNPQLRAKLSKLLQAFPYGYTIETDTDTTLYHLEPIWRLQAYIEQVRHELGDLP